MTTTLLVPLTMDPETERSLDPAVRLAHHTGANLVLFTWSFDDGEAALETLRLHEIARGLPVRAVVEARCTEEKSPAPAIVRAAREHDAQIVMASHGRTGIGELVFGSIAEEVLQLTDRPIILIGPDSTPHTGPIGPVVACVDGSDLAESALPAATDAATRLGTELRLVEALDPNLVAAIAATGGDVLESGYLARTISSMPPALRPSFEVLHGWPPAAIARYAAASGAELVAVATHGRTGAARTVLGSVAANLVRHAPCPVLISPAAR